jgi:hypothetical protein
MKKAIKQGKTTFTLVELQKALSISLEMKKASKGHLFSKTMGERCVFCGQDRKTKKECEFWFLTFMDRLQTILINPQFFTDDDIEAIWLQHAAEYSAIAVPISTEKKKQKDE